MKDEKTTFKSASQAAQFGFLIGAEIIKAIDGQVESGVIQRLIADKDESSEFKQFVSEITERILNIKSDPWKREKEKISKFTREVLGIEVDWTKVVIPTTDIPGMSHLEYIPASLSEDQLFALYAKQFGKDKVWKYYDSITKAIKEQQARPAGDYAMLHRGGDEPDTEHLNKSYNDFSQDGKKYMVVKEGLIAAMRYRFETGKMYDVKGVTRFHALDSGGDVMDMGRDDDGQFSIGGNFRGFRYSDDGPREVSF